jgi:hypothetical protein
MQHSNLITNVDFIWSQFLNRIVNPAIAQNIVNNNKYKKTQSTFNKVQEIRGKIIIRL